MIKGLIKISLRTNEFLIEKKKKKKKKTEQRK